MKEKPNKYQTLKNDLERLDPGRDADIEFAEEDLFPDRLEKTGEPDFRERAGRAARNFFVILLCIAITGLWYVDWDFSAFADRTSDVVTSVFGDNESQTFNVAPTPPAPGTVVEGNANQGMRMLDYMAAMQEAGYREQFSTPAITAFYQSGVPISYLDGLHEAEYLETLSFPAIITYFQSGVTIEYLDALKAGGYLDRFPFHAVTAFFQENISVEYLDELKASGLLEDLSFHDILIMSQNR